MNINIFINRLIIQWKYLTDIMLIICFLLLNSMSVAIIIAYIYKFGEYTEQQWENLNFGLKIYSEFLLIACFSKIIFISYKHWKAVGESK